MKAHILVFVVLVSCRPDAAAPRAPNGASTLAGTWFGSVELRDQSLAIQVIFEDNSSGTIDVPEQGATHVALSKLVLAGNAVTFEVSEVDAKFAGTLDGDAIAGTMTQSGHAVPFSIRRRAKNVYVPQLPATGGAPLLGEWQGTSGELAITAELATRNGVVAGTARLGRTCKPAQPIAQLAFAPPRVNFEAAGAYFDGELAGATITGTLHYRGSATPFTIARIDRRALPYREIEVAIESANAVTLAGTLTVPADTQNAPAIVLVTGSGPQDRDECVYGVRPFRQLADHLARHGIATLRYDDRGTARSTGDFDAATAVDFTDDAEAAVRFLRARPEIDAKRVGVLGHSEGGLIAPLVALRARDLAFIVLWAGPGIALPDVGIQQTADMLRAEGTPPAEIADEVDHEKRMIAALRVAQSESEFRAALRAIVADDAWIDGKVNDYWNPWARWYLDYDPAATLAQVRCPVLAINGGMDMQVAAKPNLAAIRRALHAGHNTDFKLVELPGLNHVFQPTTTGAVSEYAKKPPVLDGAVLETTTHWVARHVKHR